MAHELIVLYQRAFDLHLSLLPEHFAAAVRPFPYDPVETARKAPWSKQLAGMMIAGDIQETLNAIHQWGDQVLSLRAWCAVAASDAFDEQDHWTVRAAFIEPVATWCLLQPAATRDRLGNVATNLVHQGRLTLDAGYKDVLVQDNLSGRGQMNRFLNRPAREAQLSRLDDRFSAFPAFIDSLEALDDAPFREATSDFRNRASHSIAPRFEQGFTQMAVRRVGPRRDLVEQGDGSRRIVDDATKPALYYSFGGTPPLSLTNAARLVGEEFTKARDAVGAYVRLAEEIMGMLPPGLPMQQKHSV